MRLWCLNTSQQGSNAHSPELFDDDANAGEAGAMGLKDLKCCLFLGIPVAAMMSRCDTQRQSRERQSWWSLVLEV